MRIVNRQTILIKYHTLFFLKIRKDVTKFASAAVRLIELERIKNSKP